MAYPRNALVTIFGDAQTAKQELPRYCAREVEASYKLLVAVLATLTRFSAAQRRGVEELLAALQKVAATMTSDAGWLDNNTKAIAVEKLERVRTTLWPGEAFTSAEELRRVYASFPENASSFADFWIESRRNQRELFGSPEGYETQKLARSYAQPYLSYMHVANLVPISIGALSAPAYYPNGTKAMLYGGFGYWYAKNLLHAVDEGGVKVDPRRRVVTSWVANVTQEAFGARVLRCLGDGDSIFPEIPALEVAFSAFQAARTSGDAVVSRNFTEEQIFFLTACHMSCASSAEDNLYGGDCNKAVRNFKPFAEAFDCPEGSPMNPAKKCTFFH
ncbi:endothelin-converting enzyme 1-like [Haemaphysalis longicornis]